MEKKVASPDMDSSIKAAATAENQIEGIAEVLGPIAPEMPVQVVDADQLNKIINTMQTGVKDNPLQGQNYSQGQGKIIPNAPFMPNPNSFASSMANAAAAQRAAGAQAGIDPFPGAGDAGAVLGQAFEGTLNELQEAVSFREDVKTKSTYVNLKDSTVSMPADVRDIPNRLYYYIDGFKNYHYIRQKADKIMFAVFGEDLGQSVQMAAAMRGYDHKPLLWVSQVAWEYIIFETPYNPLPGGPTFDPALDESPNSGILEALRLFLDGFTIRQLSRQARYTNISIVSVIRGMFTDIVTAMKLQIPPLAIQLERAKKSA